VVADTKADPIVGAFLQGGSPSFVATQVDVIQSDRVALRAVALLKLTESPQIRQQWMEDTHGEGSLELWLAEAFQKRLVVKPSRDSNVITVSFTAPDPKFAAGVANAFVQAYMDTSLELRVDPARQYSSFFVTRAKEARAALEAAQTKLSAYQQSAGIVASDERLDVENARLAELSTQLVSMQALAAESGSRTAQAVTSAERLPEVLNNPLIGSLKAELARNEARMKELSARLGDNHPNVQELRASIVETRDRIEQEVKRISGSIGVNNSVNRAREADVRGALSAQREKVLKLKAARDELNVMQKDVENAQRAYDAVTMRLNQTSLESQTTQSNISVLTTAVAPLQHSAPKLLLNLVLAVLVGGLLAVGAATGAERLDRRLRCREDVEAALGLPVVGVMLHPGRRSKLSHFGVARAQRQRFFAALEGPKAGH
jgi:chain length determinant protein EpsF